MARILLLTLFSTLLVFADENESSAQSHPPVRELGDGRYQIGQVSFDENSREISFPAQVNMTECQLEFAIVHEMGKTHESLLNTTASALNINIALKLLRYQTSKELFTIMEGPEDTGRYPNVPEEQKAASRLRILVSWKKDGETIKIPINELIYHLVREKPMEPQPWIYHGSYIHMGDFKAESQGDLAAIFKVRSALFNYSGTDNSNDEVWIPTPDKVPAVGTPVTVTIAPLLKL